MNINKKIFINGKIIAKTGLHIGGSSLGLSIGNTENTVVRNPFTNEPYIPGSSIRGKMRSLIERFTGLFGDEPMSDEVKRGPYVGGKDGSGKDHFICKIFGMPAEKAGKYGVPPSRLIVRDGNLLNAQVLEKSRETDMPFTEVKTEVVIDRITSAAMPRQLERVPAGAEFGLNLVLNVWNEDDEQEMLNWLFRGLVLLQNDYLGGHGSRGSGQVKIVVDSLAEKNLDDYKANAAPRKRSDKIPDELQPEEATSAAN